jgi:aromatic-L-amino-acid decarboxylase
MAFFPASSTYPGMLGELYSSAFTAAAFNWLCSPAITELETIVLDWLADLMGLPGCFKSNTEGGGVIQGSASEAIVTVMVAARDRYLREATKDIKDEAEKERNITELRGKLVALGSDHAHSSTHKAALICGTKFKTVPTELKEGLAMTGDALAKTLKECEAQGFVPFYITATLGSTATCAVDKFEEIAQVVRSHPLLWVHVDAAYAGSALICPEYHYLSQQMEPFNSFDMNMHKWLLTNFDAR